MHNKDELTPAVERLYKHAEEIFRLGFDDQGACTALAYTRRLHARNEYLRACMAELGMQCRYDDAANLIALWLPAGVDASTPKIMLTSHLDTVYNAGRYDGVLGLIVALEAVRRLIESEVRFRHPIEIRVCMGEESPGITATFGSLVATGAYSYEDLLRLPLAFEPQTDVVEAINRYFREYAGRPDFTFTRQSLDSLQVQPADYLAALEIHIEQFTLLADLAESGPEKLPYVGVMNGVGGHLRAWLELEAGHPADRTGADITCIEFEGQGGHSGATPMGDQYRQDAALAAARLAVALFEERQEIVDLCGFEIVDPSATTIPPRARLYVSPGLKAGEAFDKTLQQLAAETGGRLIEAGLLQEHDARVVYTLARMVTGVNEAALDADPAEQLRATVTMIENRSGRLRFYCDIRGADSAAMRRLLEDTGHLAAAGVKCTTQVVSSKAPVMFNRQTVGELENHLDGVFQGRVMKGNISVPGQDIANFSAAGIDCCLLFIESGTGHHPGEAVRPPAMHSALLSCLEALQLWDRKESRP